MKAGLYPRLLAMTLTPLRGELLVLDDEELATMRSVVAIVHVFRNTIEEVAARDNVSPDVALAAIIMSGAHLYDSTPLSAEDRELADAVLVAATVSPGGAHG